MEKTPLTDDRIAPSEPLLKTRGRNVILATALFACLAAASPVLPAEEQANYTETIPGTKPPVTFDMVFIKGGTFKMGSPETEEGRKPDEGPVQTVTIEPFWMGKYEVSWEEYEEYWMTEPNTKNPSPADAVTRPSNAYEPPDKGWGRGKRPAMHLTYHAAMHYCEWISRKTGKFYRLPTEAEWEYACRGGAETRYFFGNDAKDLGDYAWFAGNSKEKTQDAGQKKPNPFGLYDMLGNVMEYCLGSYTKDYSDFKPVGELPKRNEKGVLRGGSFLDPPDRLRCASRQPVLAKWNERNPQRPVGAWWFTDGYMCGLRVVRPVKQEERPTLPKDPKE